MESFIKEEGIAVIKSVSKEAIDKHIASIALEANNHLLNAEYAESLLPSVEEQINQYQQLIDDAQAKIEKFKAEAEELTKSGKGQAGYKLLKENVKPLEGKIRTYTAGRDKMVERFSSTQEKIHSHRFDAQATMHRIAFFKQLNPDVLSEKLVKHIEGLAPKAEEPKKEEPAPETPAEETPAEEAQS